MTYGIYESNNLIFYDLCKKTRYIPAPQINEKDNFNRNIVIKTIKYSKANLTELSCQDYEEPA